MGASITQPNPLAQPFETLRVSEPVVIVTGDMELSLPRVSHAADGTIVARDNFPLTNVARFAVVSRDRLRFHVQIEHKWREWADPATWKATLIIHRHHHAWRYRPNNPDDDSRTKHVVLMWDWESRSVVRNRFGDIVRVNNDGYLRRHALGSLSVFRGTGDFVFFRRNLFSSDIDAMSLVLERSGFVYRFTWKFQDNFTVARADPHTE
ncbi:MAG TPA: hypothetical protein VFG83_04710 [Kofleriaceae bacterium]|nr:hypothetical protein [Kofleriaceae bacterium]